MGWLSAAFSRRNIVMIAAGVLLAGAPVIVFNIWLDGFIQRQGQAEVTIAARRAVSLADSRLDQAIATLDELARGGVSSCRSSDIDAMRRAVFGTEAIKAIAILGPDGKTLCSNLNLPQRKLMSSQPIDARPDAARLRRGGHGARQTAGHENLVQFRRQAVR
ncbi:MAG: CSS-motif domain-containing protein [Pseudolabrys sp.]